MTRKIELFDSNKHSGLAWAFQVSPSSCGNHEHYEQYIRFIAATDNISGMGTTHVFIEEDENETHMIGFITLKATSIVSVCEGKPYGAPAIEITELAIDERYTGQGCGSTLVAFAAVMAQTMNKEVAGIKHLALCADPMSAGFYERMNFTRLSDSSAIPTEGWNSNCIPMYFTIAN